MSTTHRLHPLFIFVLSITVFLSSALVIRTPPVLAAGPDLSIETTTVQTGQPVSLSISFAGNSSNISSTAFWVDYDESCLSFDGTDSNSDGLPDAVSFNLPAAFSGSVVFDSANSDSELRFVIADFSYPLAALPDGNLLTMTFASTCTPPAGGSTTVPVRFSTAQAPSFGNTSGANVSGTSTDGAVTIQSTAPATGPDLSIGTTTIQAGQLASLPISFAGNSNDIASTAFWVDYDESCLSFDGTDSNNDGLPDAVSFNLPAAFSGSVVFDSANSDSELRFVIADFSYPLAALPDGNLLTMTFASTCTPPAGGSITAPVRFSTAQAPSFGNTSGASIAGTTFDGSVTIQASGPTGSAELALGHATGNQGATVQVPLSASDLQGLLGADLVITYDSSVATAQSVTATGLANGWMLQANTSTPGQIVISMAGFSGASGSGDLATIDFVLSGQAGASTTLSFASVLLNDGAISATTSNGSLTINALAISGTVRFWNQNRPVSGATLSLSGNATASASTATDGTYDFPGLASGDYTLTASKNDDINSITSYDASLVLQHAVGNSLLSGHALTAADANQSGSINSMDASYIMQYAVGLISLPFPGAGSIWLFEPPSYTYTAIDGDVVNQDFTAIILGDPSGGWTDQSPAPVQRHGVQQAATLRIETGAADADGYHTAILWLDDARSDVHSLDLLLATDIHDVTIVATPATADCELLSNLNASDGIRVALASPAPLDTSSPLLNIRYRPADDKAAPNVLLAQVDEQVVVATQASYRVFLPLIQH